MKKRKSLKSLLSFRLLGMLLVATFLFVGVQDAQAQKGLTNPYPTDQALEVLNVEIGDLLAAKATQPESPTLEHSVEGYKVLYYKGIALRLKEGMSTNDAVEANHAAIVAIAPAIEQAAINLKDQASALLSQ
jgi:hypothetical protein